MLDRLSERLHPQELIKLRAAAEAKPLPTPQAPKPLGWGRAMIDYLNAEAPVEPRTLGMRRPAAPAPAVAPKLPSRDLIEYVTAVSVAINADYERHLDTLRTIDEISAMLTEHPELLAPPSHPGPRLWLRRIVAALAPLTAKGC